MRAARYVRVSTEQQARNTSIPNQLERTETYVEGMGWDLVATFEEPGESGADLDRPALNACRAAAKAKRYDVLVIYDLDRFNRNLRDLPNLRYEFQQLGIPIYSICDSVEMTSCDESVFIQVVLRGVFSQVERDKINRRLREGVESHVKAGKYPGGVPPYGYRRDDQSYLVVHEPEARIVRSIFQWTIDGLTLHKVADRLNGMGLPGPRGGPWRHCTIALILHSETYTGQWLYGRRGSKLPKIAIDVPPIVDQSIREDAQTAIAKNRTKTAKPIHHYLLRGLIQCECGSAYCGRSAGRDSPTYYRCQARYAYPRNHPRRCHSATIHAAELEEVVWTDIEEFVRQPHLVADELTRRRIPAGARLIERIAEVDKAIGERREEIDRYLILYGRGTIPVEQLDAKVSEAKTHVVALETYRANLIEEQRRADLWEREMCGLIEALTVLQEKLAAGVSWDDMRSLVEMLVKEIRVETATDEDGERYPIARITYRFERPETKETPIPIELEPLFVSRERCLAPFHVL